MTTEVRGDMWFSHYSVFMNQSFCTSLKVASSESRLFYTATVGHKSSASDCQKEKMLLRYSDVPQAIQELETEKKIKRMWGREEL